MASAAPAPLLKTVGVVTVTQGDVARTMAQPGTIQGIEEATLYAKTSGYLQSILVDKGDRVRAGQLIATIASPELAHQQQQARAAYQQSEANALGVAATRGRAVADVAQADAAVARARSDTRQAEAVIARAKADQARAEAQLPKAQALAQEADSGIEQAAELAQQAQADIGRYQQQVKAAQAGVRAAESAVAKADADTRLQQTTYSRLKAVQDKDSGLIAGQQVDEARARLEASRSDLETARSRLDAAKDDVATVEQQLEGARRAAAAAARKVDATKSHAQAAREDVQAARQDAGAARQQVKVAEAQRDGARQSVKVAQAQRQALAQQVSVAHAQIAAAREQVQGNRSAMAAAADLAGYTRITAPFDGVVTERLVDPGALVQNASGSQAGARGIVHVVRDSMLRVMIPVPEGNIASIRRGQPVKLTTDAFPGVTFAGTVTRFASAVDPKSRTMLTEVDLPNPGGRLRPGMYARVVLTLGVHRGALSLPTEAIMGKEDDRSVYVVKDGKARKTRVAVGVDDGKSAEIVSGLRPGDQVVLVGRDSLVDGAPVKAEPAPTGAPVR